MRILFLKRHATTWAAGTPTVALFRRILRITLLICSISANAEDGKVKLLTLVSSDQPLQVRLFTSGDLGRGILFGAAGALVANVRNSRFAEQLTGTVGDYSRVADARRAVGKLVWARYASYFDITVAEDPARYVNAKGEIGFPAVRSGGYSFVLRIQEDYSGLMTLAAFSRDADTVAPFARYSYQLFDATRGKRISKGVAAMNGLQGKNIKEAVLDRAFFVEAYPRLMESVMRQIGGRLNKDNRLHEMAQASGVGDKVPAIGQILSIYDDRFSFEMKAPKGWRTAKTGSKYSTVVEPTSKDRFRVGVRHDVDLLLEELGQGVETLEQYQEIFFARLGELGYAVETIRPFTGLSLDGKYRTFEVTRPDGGKDLLAFTQPGKLFIEVFNVVFIKDFDELYARYRKDIESAIGSARMTVKP